MAGKPNILFLDIETSPILGRVWGLFQQDVTHVERDSFIMCFAAKRGDGKTTVFALPDYPGYKKDRSNDKSLVADLWKELDWADVVVTHNGDKFDLKRINTRFVVHGFKPHSPIKSIDTLKMVKKHFGFSSNRLGYVAQALGLGNKAAHTGIQMWVDCDAGNMVAWKLLTKYCKQDVELGYKIHQMIHPWATTYPTMTVFAGEDGLCPHCLQDSLQKRGVGTTRTGQHQRYQCMKCGAWSRGRGTTVVKIT